MAAIPRFLRRAFLRALEDHASQIPDNVHKLRYLRTSIATHQARTPRARRFLQAAGVSALAAMVLFALLHKTSGANTPRSKSASLIPLQQVQPAQASSVWLVEQTAELEVYSNGLRIENQFAASNKPRSYRTIDRVSLRFAPPRSDPAGIVFHTTESQMAPFEAHQNESLKRNGLGMLAYVSKNRLYHFVIDRFGRVFRIVPETDFASHAGYSVWGDLQWIYMNLNQSFLGVSFEAQTADSTYIANAAQLHAGKVLTEMLRSKYGIPEKNCVTHAQVSVNPQSMYIGAHTDWADNFPFRELGLSNGYELPLASVTDFGFSYDAVFLRANGARTWKGLVSSEEHLLRDAAAHGMTPSDYRKHLQKRYRETVAGLRNGSGDREKNNEQL